MTSIAIGSNGKWLVGSWYWLAIDAIRELERCWQPPILSQPGDTERGWFGYLRGLVMGGRFRVRRCAYRRQITPLRRAADWLGRNADA